MSMSFLIKKGHWKNDGPNMSPNMKVARNDEKDMDDWDHHQLGHPNVWIQNSDVPTTCVRPSKY